MPDLPRLGFACLWDADPTTTWSHTPWNLRAGMLAAGTADLVDVGVRVPPNVATALKALHTRWRDGRPVTTWRYSSLTDAYCRRTVERAAALAGCEAVLQIQDLAPLSMPYYLYQDLSWDALLAVEEPQERAALLTVSRQVMLRRRERQLTIYERAAGVLAMSEWFARSLVERTGLSAEKVHVVPPGLTSGRKTPPRRAPRPDGEKRTRLLLVGRDFHRKGGELAVAALALLRADVDPAITLTVAGPRDWPLPGGPPPGVTFLGPLPTEQVARLYDSHDLFVMPSRMEPFGIVFAEALSRGLPCVGRDAYAMPEVITPGVNGALVGGDDADELAKAIAGVLADDEIYRICAERAPQTSQWFSWERAGRQVLSIMTG
jgi:glycosyltransferase involved in cell wall biosynthesis